MNAALDLNADGGYTVTIVDGELAGEELVAIAPHVILGLGLFDEDNGGAEVYTRDSELVATMIEHMLGWNDLSVDNPGQLVRVVRLVSEPSGFFPTDPSAFHFTVTKEA